MAKGTSLVKFNDYSDDEAAEDAKEAASLGGGRLMKLKTGKTVVRALPAKPGKKFRKTTHQHSVDVPGVGTVFLNCARLMAKQPCAVCKLEQKLLAFGNPKDEAKAKKLRAKPRFYINVIERGAEENGPRVLAFGKQINDQLIEIRQDPDEGGNYVHPINGFDIIIRRKGTGQNDTEYTVTASKTRPKALHEDAAQMNEWIENQHDLDQYGKVLTLKQQEAKLRGEDIDEDEDDEEEAPKPKKGKKPSRTIDEDDDVIDVEAVVVDDDDD